jgi:hypothetical protein
MTKIIKKSKMKKISSTSYKYIQSGGTDIKFKYKQIRKTIQDNKNDNILSKEESLFGVAKVEKLTLISFSKKIENIINSVFKLKDIKDTIECTNPNVFSFENLLKDVFEEKIEKINNNDNDEKYQYLCFGNYLKLDVSTIFSDGNGVKGKNDKYSYFDLDNREHFLKPIKIDGNFFRFYAIKTDQQYYTINNYLEFTNNIIYTVDKDKYLCSKYPAPITEIIFQTKLDIDFDDYMSDYFKCEKKRNNVNEKIEKIDYFCDDIIKLNDPLNKNLLENKKLLENKLNKYKLSETIQNAYNLNTIDLSNFPDIVSMSSSSFHPIYKSLIMNKLTNRKNTKKNKLTIIVKDNLQKKKIISLLNPDNIEIIISNESPKIKISNDSPLKLQYLSNISTDFIIYKESQNNINTVFFKNNKSEIQKDIFNVKDQFNNNNKKNKYINYIKKTPFLFLKDNRFLERIHPNAFEGFINLQAINLSKSFIFKINSNTFKDCGELRFIDLSHCVYLSSFDEEAFKGLKDCIIDCRNSLNLNIIHKEAFKDCENITILVNESVKEKINTLINVNTNINIETYYGKTELEDDKIYPQMKYYKSNIRIFESYKAKVMTNKKEYNRISSLSKEEKFEEESKKYIQTHKTSLLQHYSSFNISNKYLKDVLRNYNINITDTDPNPNQIDRVQKIIRMYLAKKKSINEQEFNNFIKDLEEKLEVYKKNLETKKEELIKKINLPNENINTLIQDINTDNPLGSISKDLYKELNSKFTKTQKELLSQEKYGKKYVYFKKYQDKLKLNKLLFSKIMTGTLKKRGPSSKLIQAIEEEKLN